MIHLEVFFAFAWNETCRFIPWQAGLLSVPACYRDPVLVLLEALVRLWPSDTSASLVIRWFIHVHTNTWYPNCISHRSHIVTSSHITSSTSENLLSHPGPCGRGENHTKDRYCWKVRIFSQLKHASEMHLRFSNLILATWHIYDISLRFSHLMLRKFPSHFLRAISGDVRETHFYQDITKISIRFCEPPLGIAWNMMSQYMTNTYILSLYVIISDNMCIYTICTETINKHENILVACSCSSRSLFDIVFLLQGDRLAPVNYSRKMPGMDTLPHHTSPPSTTGLLCRVVVKCCEYLWSMCEACGIEKDDETWCKLCVCASNSHVIKCVRNWTA